MIDGGRTVAVLDTRDARRNCPQVVWVHTGALHTHVIDPEFTTTTDERIIRCDVSTDLSAVNLYGAVSRRVTRSNPEPASCVWFRDTLVKNTLLNVGAIHTRALSLKCYGRCPQVFASFALTTNAVFRGH